MAQLGSFDAEAVNPDAGYTPVPPNVYTMIVTHTEIKASKNKPTNRYLSVEHTITEGDFKNRKITNLLNLWNDNPDAVRISEAMLSQLCRAVGKMKIEDTVELHGIPFQAKVSVDAKGDKPQNRIDEYLYEGRAATVTAAPKAAGQATAAPWAK